MAEKNDDIKNLFLNLGLNPSDYHEIRTAPSANATVGEAPRRWSLLQAATVGKPASTAVPASILSAMSIPPPPVFAAPPVVAAPLQPEAPARLPPRSTQTAEDKATASQVTNSMAAVLFAAACDIARVEAGELPLPQAAVPAPAVATSTPADDLRSLFQSVKEPQTVSVMPEPFDSKLLTGRRTDQLYGRTPVAATPTERAAAADQVRPAGSALGAPNSRLVSDEDAETRSEPSPTRSRLGPVPAAAAPAYQPAAGEGKLRFSNPAAAPAASGHGDSLRDVFARLSRENGR